MVADPAHHATGYLEKYSLDESRQGIPHRSGLDRRLQRPVAGHPQPLSRTGRRSAGSSARRGAFGKFLQDQLRERSVLFNDTTRHLFYAPQQTIRGTPVAMTLGWHIGDLDGTRFFYKEGGGGGFHCMMRLYPGDGIGTVVMTNATGFDARKLLDTIHPPFLRGFG